MNRFAPAATCASATSPVFSFSGFRDGHAHPLFASRESQGPDLTQITDLTELLDVITAFLREHPQLEWLDCGSYSPDFAAENNLHRRLLDQVSTSIPIVVHCEDHHSIWVNSVALERAGVAEQAPKLKNASFDVDAQGLPTGIVREWDAMSLIYEHQPKPSLSEDLEAWDRAQETLLSKGIVAVQEAWIDPGMPEVFLAAAEQDNLKIRVNLAPRIDQNAWRESLVFAKQTRSAVRAVANPLLTANTVKIFIDGVFGSKTALLHGDYCDGTRASGLWNPAELAEMALAADSAGFQLHFHAIGDAAVSKALDVIELVSDINGPVDRRPVIAHAELISDPDVTRLKNLGVVVCQQPVWAEADADRAALRSVIGDELIARLYPLRSLVENGVITSFGSDWPVSDPAPLPGIRAATKFHLNPEQQISRTQAVAAYSVNVAYQLGQTHTLHEDLVVLSEDPTDIRSDLSSIQVLKVLVAGRLVWSASH